MTFDIMGGDQEIHANRCWQGDTVIVPSHSTGDDVLTCVQHSTGTSSARSGSVAAMARGAPNIYWWGGKPAWSTLHSISIVEV